MNISKISTTDLLTVLVDSLEECSTAIDDNSIYEDIFKVVREKIADLNTYLNIEGQTELIEFNFYQFVKSEFYSKQKRAKKRYAFEIEKDGSFEQCNDEEFLNDFCTIKHCLPIIKDLFLNILDNAYKYMLDHNELTIKLKKFGNLKDIKFINIGPALLEDERTKVFDYGYRGVNAVSSNTEGQGLGLNQIKSILDLHKNWLDATINVCPEEINDFELGGIPYSLFSLELTIEEKQNDTDKRTHLNSISELEPVLIHNVNQIINDISSSIVKKMDGARNPIKSVLLRTYYKLAEVKGLFLYNQWIDDKIPYETLFGNPKDFNLNRLLAGIQNSINNNDEKVIKVEGSRKCYISLFSAFESIIYLFILFICKSISKKSTLFIEIDEDRIIFEVEEEFSFSELFLSEGFDNKHSIVEFFEEFLNYSQIDNNLKTSTNYFYIELP